LRDSQSSVQIAGLDQDQAGQVLLALDERSVGEQQPSVVIAQTDSKLVPS
jgi:hypothetical protein